MPFYLKLCCFLPSTLRCNTNRPTVLALSNSKNLTIRISASEKQKLIKTLSYLYLPHKTYIYQVFAALVYILLIEQNPTDVLIDIEYSGKNNSIKEVLIQLFHATSAGFTVRHAPIYASMITSDST